MKPPATCSRWLIVVALFSYLSGSIAQDPWNSSSLFVRSDVMIPMRDGVKLHTVVFVPRDVKEALPILLNRTPYGALGEEKALRTNTGTLFLTVTYSHSKTFVGASSPTASS